MLHKYQSFSVGSETRRAVGDGAVTVSPPPDSFRLCSFEIIKQNREDINLSRIGGGAVFFARCLIHFQSDLYGRRERTEERGWDDEGGCGGENRRRRLRLSERRNGIWLEYQLHSAEANKPLSRSQKRKRDKKRPRSLRRLDKRVRLRQ